MARSLSRRSTLAAFLTALLVPLGAPGDVAAEWIPESAPPPGSSRFT